jgi:hypothetical protein
MFPQQALAAPNEGAAATHGTGTYPYHSYQTDRRGFRMALGTGSTQTIQVVCDGCSTRDELVGVLVTSGSESRTAYRYRRFE